MPTGDALIDTHIEIFTARTTALDVFAAPDDEARPLALRHPDNDAQLLRVAVAQCDAVLGETAHNTRRLREMLQTAVDHGARLAVFPQAAISGYNAATRHDALQNAIDPDGEEIADIAATCARLQLYAVIGSLTRADGILRDSAFLFGPEGVLGQYDRAHTNKRGADAFIQPGHAGFVVYQTPIGKIGLLVGRDLYFPSAAHALASREVEIIAAPCAWTAEDWPAPEFVARTRAYENTSFILAATRVGEERGLNYIGRSCIIAPNGIHLANAYPDEEHLIIADINLRDAQIKLFGDDD
ncbi:MAG TPA: carbon-nitrogen hydrolase family protein [Thermoflexales bacterium]|nr:carbon-nitrogen hydrolase family protein [Thermoflexales bacterium]HQW34551.1 carbon-nitrogen hydrolase family protein [Thermoflexales bacterium]HQZ21988.1 carbon-nitrogen hydrolase family protein [Thermoflexales bacterium]